MHGKVLFNYKANNSNIEDKDDYEVDLSEGSVIEILEMYDDGWWLVQTQLKTGVSVTGLAPSNYIELNDDSLSKSESKLYLSPMVITNSARSSTNDNEPTIGRQLPPGWKEAVDAESNDKYYYNSATGYQCTILLSMVITQLCMWCRCSAVDVSGLCSTPL